MSSVYDYDERCDAFCPFANDVCRMECMLMRPTGLGEPRCSIRVIADELVLINGELKEEHNG